MFLTPFVRVFKSQDVDRDGTLTEYQFRQVVEKLIGNSAIISELLQRVDPYNN